MKDYTTLKEVIMEEMQTKELNIKSIGFNEFAKKMVEKAEIKELMNQAKEMPTKDENIVLDYFHGGYASYSEYFYIVKENDNYLFKYGNDYQGRILKPNNVFLRTIIKSKVDYELFIEKLNAMTNNWEEKYVNNDILDGTQWHLEYNNKRICGSNAYPNNYNEIKEFLLDAFGGKYEITKLSVELLGKVKDITGMNMISVISNQRTIPDLNAMYIYSSLQGGMAIIVKSNGEYLLGNSGFNPIDMVSDFKEGKRTGNLND